jgi:hypothetical protein
MSQIIFDLTRKDYSYKGVLFAELDNKAVQLEMGDPTPMPKGYIAGVMAIIFTNENREWHLTARIKFPSGNKQVIRLQGGKDSNETKMLHELYKMPLIHKKWTKNPDGTPEGILKIIEDLDMIESLMVIKDAKPKI